MPFGPPGTRAKETRDNRMVLAADKGPYINASVPPPPRDLRVAGAPREESVTPNVATENWSRFSPKAWHPFNSPNHQGEGQNVLFADGHASFMRTPTVGVDHDNIYTIMLDNEHLPSRAMGESPWARSAHPFVPIDAEGNTQASTDSVIYP